MALESAEWAAVAGVFAVILAVMLYNQFRAKSAPIQAAGAEEEHSVDPRLSRFAVHEGEVVGETVAVEGDRLILKQAGVFKSVPAAIAVLEGDDVQLRGEVDWAKAEADGAGWLESNRKGTDDQVTSDLTKSEDVKAPAREAFEKRQAEAEGGFSASDSEE